MILTEAQPNANLVTNGTFEIDLSGWSALLGSIYHDTDSYEGSYSLRGDPFGFIAYDSQVQSDTIAVNAGQIYDYSLYYKRTFGTAVIDFKLHWIDSGDVAFSDTLLSVGTSDTWELISGSVQAPVGSVKVKFFITESFGSDYGWLIDDVQLSDPSAPEFTPAIIIPLVGLVLAITIAFKQRKKV